MHPRVESQRGQLLARTGHVLGPPGVLGYGFSPQPFQDFKLMNVRE